MRTLNNIQTKDRIAQVIRDEILSGNIEPEEELVQEELAEMLDVSRMPVREALQTLVQEGFAKRLANRHIQAVVPDKRQIREVFEMAGMMEAELAAVAVRRQGENLRCLMESAGELKEILLTMANTPERAGKIRAEQAFHEGIIKMADNPYLEQLMNKVMAGYIAYAVEHLSDSDRAAEYLMKAAEGIGSGDVSTVQEALTQYYRYYADRFTERWRVS